VEGLPGAELVAAANGFGLAFAGTPKANAVVGFVADVGVCPNVKAEAGRLSSLPKLKDVLMGTKPSKWFALLRFLGCKRIRSRR
jgi:hypothetical protein